MITANFNQPKSSPHPAFSTLLELQNWLFDTEKILQEDMRNVPYIIIKDLRISILKIYPDLYCTPPQMESAEIQPIK